MDVEDKLYELVQDIAEIKESVKNIERSQDHVFEISTESRMAILKARWMMGGMAILISGLSYMGSHFIMDNYENYQKERVVVSTRINDQELRLLKVENILATLK